MQTETRVSKKRKRPDPPSMINGDQSSRICHPDATRHPGEICVICLDEVESSGTWTDCKHLFHASCLRQWSEHKTECPLCRKSIQRWKETENRKKTERGLKEILRQTINGQVSFVITNLYYTNLLHHSLLEAWPESLGC
jgi:hypothetical protein